MVPTSGLYVQTKKMLMQFYSINVQAVYVSDAFITNIVARWPGSTHDSRIFEKSKIADKLRDGAPDGILVGDCGCACRACLMTSILKPENTGVCYITAHRRTRCVIEKWFGLLKRHFRVCSLDRAPAWKIPSSLLWPLQCCIILPLYIERKTLVKTLEMKIFHLTLFLQQTQVVMPNASPLSHDTLLNKINDLIKWHVRFIDNKIGNKREHSLQSINHLLLLFGNL